MLVRKGTILRLKKKGVMKMANRPWLNKRLSKTHREAISAGLKRFNAGKKWKANVKETIWPRIDLQEETVTSGGLTAKEVREHLDNLGLRLAIHCLETALGLLKCKL